MPAFETPSSARYAEDNIERHEETEQRHDNVRPHREVDEITFGDLHRLQGSHRFSILDDAENGKRCSQEHEGHADPYRRLGAKMLALVQQHLGEERGSLDDISKSDERDARSVPGEQRAFRGEEGSRVITFGQGGVASLWFAGEGIG